LFADYQSDLECFARVIILYEYETSNYLSVVWNVFWQNTAATNIVNSSNSPNCSPSNSDFNINGLRQTIVYRTSEDGTSKYDYIGSF
jgi:hypothetical protein